MSKKLFGIMAESAEEAEVLAEEMATTYGEVETVYAAKETEL